MDIPHITTEYLMSNDEGVIISYIPAFPFCILDSSGIQILIPVCASGSILLQGFIFRSDLCTRIMQNVKKYTTTLCGMKVYKKSITLMLLQLSLLKVVVVRCYAVYKSSQ